MRLSRIYHPTPLTSRSHTELTDAAANHVARVLRLPVGSPLILFNGEGGEYPATIEALNKHTVTVRIGEFQVRERESPLTIWLAQGISRGDRMDYTMQKAVELGVNRIIPLFTKYCGVQLNGDRLQKRIKHWQGVVISACEQCGRNRIPQITTPVTLKEWLMMMPDGDIRLVLHPDAEQRFSQAHISAERITLLVGPEGGLSDHELEQAVHAGYVAMRLGARILRTETAAITALAAAQALWGDL